MDDVKKLRRSRRRAGTVGRTEGRRSGGRLGGGSKGNFADLFNAGGSTGSAPSSPLPRSARGAGPAASPAAASGAPPAASDTRRSVKKKRMKKSATLGALQRKQMATQFQRMTLEEGDMRKPDFKLPSHYKDFNKTASFRPPEAIRSSKDHKAHRIYNEVDKPTSCVDTAGDVGDGWVYPFQYEKEERKSNALKPLKVVHQAVHKEKTANDIGPGWAPITTKDHARSASFKPPEMVGKRDAKWDGKKIKHVSRDEADAGPGWQGTGHKDWASSPKPTGGRVRQKKTKEDVELAKAGVVRRLAPYKPSASAAAAAGTPPAAAEKKSSGKKKKKKSSRDMKADKKETDVGGGWADWNTRNHAKSAPFRPREAVGKRREEREVPDISIVQEKRKKDKEKKKKKKKKGGTVRKKRAHTTETPRRSPRRSGSPTKPALDTGRGKGSRRTLSAYPESIAAWTAQLDIHPGEEDESIKEERRQWEAEQKRLSGGGDDDDDDDKEEAGKEEEAGQKGEEEEEDDAGFEEVGGEVEEHADEQADGETGDAAAGDDDGDDDEGFEEVDGDVEELDDPAKVDDDGFEEVDEDDEDEGFEEVTGDEEDDGNAEEAAAAAAEDHEDEGEEEEEEEEEFEEVDGDVEELDDDDEGFEAVEGSEEEF